MRRPPWTAKSAKAGSWRWVNETRFKTHTWSARTTRQVRSAHVQFRIYAEFALSKRDKTLQQYAHCAAQQQIVGLQGFPSVRVPVVYMCVHSLSHRKRNVSRPRRKLHYFTRACESTVHACIQVYYMEAPWYIIQIGYHCS